MDKRPDTRKRPRGKYSRLICLGCRERRIKCELPSEVDIPGPGELHTVHTPCYRCERLQIPCVVRQTILGRPGHKGSSESTARYTAIDTAHAVPRIIVELPTPTKVANKLVIAKRKAEIADAISRDALLIHSPQSAETLIIIRAIDTLRREKVEQQWFRHLPAHVGHTPALDLSIKAIVTACAYYRGVPKLASRDCYRIFACALGALQTDIKQSYRELNDDILAATALLAPFEGVVKSHVTHVPTRMHVEGLAAILSARSVTHPVTQLAREILDFHICDSAIMACIQGRPSPFESISPAYYRNDRVGLWDSDAAQLRALGSELFIRIPRLVGLARSIRYNPISRIHRSDARDLLAELLQLQDSQVESRLLQNVEVRPSKHSGAFPPFHQSLHFVSVDDFEALTYYWQNRLSLLRLEQRLCYPTAPNGVQVFDENGLEIPSHAYQGPMTNEIFHLVKNILMSVEYAETLPLNKHYRLFTHATVVAWCAMSDMPTNIRYVMEGAQVDFWSQQLLQRLPDFTTEDLHMAAEIFVGGEPRGRISQLYNL